MAITQHHQRYLVIVPLARAAGFNTWIKANINPEGEDWFSQPLSASGTAPATHYWAYFSATDDVAKKFIARLINMANLTMPAGWDTFTKGQKLQWVASQRPAIWAALAVWIEPSDNEGIWADSEAVLASLGLQRSVTNI